MRQHFVGVNRRYHIKFLFNNGRESLIPMNERMKE